MVRQRKHIQQSSEAQPVQQKSPRRKTASNSGLFDNKFSLFIIFNVALLFGVLSYVYYLHWLEARVITPFPSPKIIAASASIASPQTLWGTYRSNLYFGMKARIPTSPVAGLMWFEQKNNVRVRHWCNQWEGVQRYSWKRHDGSTFGTQDIYDSPYKLNTSVLVSSGDWQARVHIEPTELKGGVIPLASLLFYWATDDFGHADASLNGVKLIGVHGYHDDLGAYRVRFGSKDDSKLKFDYLITSAPGLDQLKETVAANLAPKIMKSKAILHVLKGQVLSKEKRNQPNFFVVQVTGKPPFSFDIAYERDDGATDDAFVAETFEDDVQERIGEFDEQFERVLNLHKKDYSPEDIDVAKSALSNMLGGIGYFYGSSLVLGPHNREPVNYWPAPLFTAVPSRSFFPRGFLWDEGFHNLLISRWNPDISLEILGHWLDLMNVDGWIPREQILGVEARAKVPAEFVVQRSSHANPPAIFLSIQQLIAQNSSGTVEFLRRAYPRLVALFDYFNTTQTGKLPNSFRWRGRDPKTRVELNPKTLASGLDDYPRASHPTEDERHLDLMCWMHLMTTVLAEVSYTLGHPHQRFVAQRDAIAKSLDTLHWSDDLQHYADYGLHTEKVVLVDQRPKPGQAPTGKVRFVQEAPKLQFVPHYGYVSLFPLMLRIVKSDSPKLGIMLSDLANTDLLWTDFGLRSLSLMSSMYNKYNTENDPPYWRGAIWINMNFLTIRALHTYRQLPGPYQTQANELYHKLRTNVIRNILREFKRTGFIWENYKDTNGNGQGCHPFTGWSALLVLLMGEQY